MEPPVEKELEEPRKAEVSRKTKMVGRIGLVLLFLAGALALISSFLPWITAGSQSTSGWTIMHGFSKIGANPLWTIHFWGSGLGGIYFTGLCTFILGLLIMVLAIVAFFSGVRTIGRVAIIFSLLPVICVMLIAIFNWYTITGTGHDMAEAKIIASPGPGTGVGVMLLVVVFVVGFVGIMIAGRPFVQLDKDRRYEKETRKRLESTENV